MERPSTDKNTKKLTGQRKPDEEEDDIVESGDNASEGSSSSENDEEEESGSEEEEEEEEEEEDSDYEGLVRAGKKGNKKRAAADAEEFASVLTSILGQDARDEQAPIMAKDKTRENQIKEEVLNYRARKALVHEKRMLLSKDRVVPTMENFDYERKLRKVATKGVIKLFNVVKAQQTELTQINSTPSVRSEKVADLSKTKFLDLLKAKTN
ncbi:Rrp15p-domain-containing protein [Martensiomyces pterosporus]|nr:Rrp15p-domain-containing protein [Martensiomyces pterosporus]